MSKKTIPVKKASPAAKQTTRITKQMRVAIDQAVEKIERARLEAGKSKQPRFSIDTAQINKYFNLIYGFAKDSIMTEPKYQVDSRKRDAWLARAVTQEPYLLGILQSVVAIDKNRGWTLIGGRNQVRKFVGILHNFQVSADIYGWRNGMSVTAQSYYQSDLGSVVEIGRTMNNGPLAGLFTVDPTQCVLTGKAETPLRYVPPTKDNQYWRPTDYFRVPSFPNPNEKFFGLGYCAVSRCLELAQLLVGVYEHEKEKLGSKAPKGILTINGLTQSQWLQSLEESNDERSVMERQYYSGVQVLASDGTPEIKVGLTSLSGLPEDFDRRQFLDMIIFGYALIFGYDPREFWPVSSGALGTATETDSQHRRATSKGGLDFALGFQEKLQEELPETIEFEFEQRDVEGDISELEMKQLELNIIKGMFSTSGNNADPATEQPLINFEEARQLLVEAKLIPEEWTPNDEPQQVTDTDDAGAEVLLEKQRVRAAIDKFPGQEIVCYNERTGKTRTIWNPNARRFTIRNAKLAPAEIVPVAPAPDMSELLLAIDDRFADLKRSIETQAPSPAPGPIVIQQPAESRTWLEALFARFSQPPAPVVNVTVPDQARAHNDQGFESIARALNDLALQAAHSETPNNISIALPAIHLSAAMPAASAPDIHFSPNIQASEVQIRQTTPVNVDVPAAINQITIEPPINQITVQPADVNIPQPVREVQKISRNKNQLIESTETEIEYKK